MTEVTDLIAKLAGIDMLGPVVDGTGVLEYPHIAFRVFFEGFVAFALFLIILLASYNVAAFIYRKARTHPVGSIYVHTPVPPEMGSSTVIDEFKRLNGIDDLRIGLILAGGGVPRALTRRAP